MNLPIIRLEIEGMKHSILHHLGLHNDEIARLVEREIDDAIKNIDLRAKVRSEVERAVTKSIEEYFRYGGGASAISQAVFESLTGEPA